MKAEFAQRKIKGFTIVELILVLAAVALVAALVLAAVASAKERALRTQCANNLRQIGALMVSYAHDNDDLFFPAKHATTNDASGFVPNAFANVSEANVTRFGLRRTNELSSIWTCPNRYGLPLFEEDLAGRFRGTTKLNQWVIGYAYFGGVTNWNNSAFTNWIASRSPVRLSDSSPDWVLAADAVMRVNGKWGDSVEGSRPRPIYWNLPPHHGSLGKRPSGGNELFVDGSVKWINFDKMFFLTTWASDTKNHQFFFYQDPSDFDPKLVERLPELSARNFK